LSVGASIGVVVEDGVSPTADLLRFVDTALYRAKAKGRGRLEVFDTAMRLELENRSLLADELHNAVTGGQPTTYLQPIVDMSTGIIHGAEALSR
jgi:predicted signal transduction protein with EAL and GGDEF domain